MAPKAPKSADNGVTEMVCASCGQAVSGPDAASVAETMERHYKKAGHK